MDSEQVRRAKERLERLKQRQLVLTDSMMRAIHDNSEWSHSGSLTSCHDSLLELSREAVEARFSVNDLSAAELNEWAARLAEGRK